MKTRHLQQLGLVLLLMVPLVLTGCDSDSGMDEDPDPVFSLSTRTVTLNDGTEGLEFFATPNTDVVVVRVDVQDPIGQSVRFNAERANVVKGETVRLSDPNVAYVKRSGTWTFVFAGQMATGSGKNYEVTASVNVSA